MPPDFDSKPLPHNVEAERAVLGACCLDDKTQAIAIAVGKLKPQDFLLTSHRAIFKAMLRMYEAQQAIDIVTLITHLQERRELEQAGGAGYISKLIDLVPKISNVGEYARIVLEKALLREAIRVAYDLEQRAQEGTATFDDIRNQLSLFLAQSSNGHFEEKPPIDQSEFLLMDFRPCEYVLDPVLPVQGIGMIYSWRGVGKTFLGLQLGYAIATGIPRCLNWKIHANRRVLYVDGEMPANVLQERLQEITRANRMIMPAAGFLRFVTGDVHKKMPDIGQAEGQRYIEKHLQEGDLLILDNLSSLSNGGKEDSEQWMPIQAWFLQLRHKGITVLFFHHAGKGGAQRGTSMREDLLDMVINLRRPANYAAEEGYRCEVHVEKIRGKSPGDTIAPFEISITESKIGGSVFTTRALKAILEQRAVEMLQMRMPIRDICDELHLSRWQVYRLKQKVGAPTSSEE